MKNLRSKLVLIFFLLVCIAAEFIAASCVEAAPVKVGIVNLSNEFDIDVQRITEALQIQVKRDFAPVYNIDAEIKFYSTKETIPANVWKIYLVQRYNFPELGFHYVDSDGTPAARVSVERSNEWGKPPSLVLSHELLEMLANPYVDRAVVISNDKSKDVELFLFEVSDAVMSVECGYKINGFLMSDFVFPWWFDPKSQQKEFSFNKCVSKPLKIARAGYMPYMKLFRNNRGGFAEWKRKI